jgi:signal transduction histidine kinase
VSATDGEVELAVSDRGVGIPPEELGNLFLPFHSRPGAPEITPGVGLGLSIVRRIVKAHGGHIDVESTPNAGSTFRVRLPRDTRTDRDVEQRC